MAFENIALTFEESYAILTIDRPKALNALNVPTLREMVEAVREVEGHSGVRALIITGAGDKAFIAGADIRQMSEFDVEEGREFGALGHRLLRSLETLPIPVIAAVNGFALGGGTEVLLACDIAYASTNARLGQPEVKLGIIPGFGGTQRLPRLVGPMMARELIYTGRIINPQEALRIGLVSKVLPPDQLMPAVRKLVDEIIAVGPLAVAAAKKLILDGADVPLPEANEMEMAAFANLFETNDRKEGMGAFLEKRPARFTAK